MRATLFIVASTPSNMGNMTRTQAERIAADLNAKAKLGLSYVASYAGKGWRVERWRGGKFEGIECDEP